MEIAFGVRCVMCDAVGGVGAYAENRVANHVFGRHQRVQARQIRILLQLRTRLVAVHDVIVNSTNQTRRFAYVNNLRSGAKISKHIRNALS